MPSCPPHHWRIAPPEGPTSLGVCRKCKAKRLFLNSTPEQDVANIVLRHYRRASVEQWQELIDGLREAKRGELGIW